MDKQKIPTLEEELKSYSRKDLLEEITRLRLVVIQGNVNAFKKAKQNQKEEFLMIIDRRVSEIESSKENTKESNIRDNIRDFKKLAILELKEELNNGNDGIPPKPKDLGILPNFI